jgi:hypothetical protein
MSEEYRPIPWTEIYAKFSPERRARIEVMSAKLIADYARENPETVKAIEAEARAEAEAAALAQGDGSEGK